LSSPELGVSTFNDPLGWNVVVLVVQTTCENSERSQSEDKIENERRDEPLIG